MYRLLAFTALLVSCGGPPQMPQMPPPQVGVAKPIQRDLPVTRDLTGRLEAVERVEIKPQVSGQITKVWVQDGAMVKAGDKLFSIDPESFAATVARAQAGVAQAQAGQQLASDALGRNAKLLETKIISQQNYDDSVQQEKAASAALAAAQAALRLAQLDESRATVTAPITGRLGRILTTAGNLVQGGGPVPATVLTTLVSIDPMFALMDLDEASYSKIAPRLGASVEGKKPVPVQIGLSGETGFSHSGSITFVDNQIDNASGSIRIRASIPNPNLTLTPGAFVRIRLTVSDPKPTILIHEQAVQAKLLTRYVLVVDEKGITTFCPVVLGPAHGAMREVLSGLNADDTIVATNLAKVLAPGMPVIPQHVDMETLKMHSESATTAPIHP